MPNLRKTDEEVIAILLADIHLSFEPPVWRSAEPNWFDTMKWTLLEITELSFTHNCCPVIAAGDIFDHWYGATKKNAPALINFALRYLPDMYAIPGQHDLPLHSYDDIKRSAYYTLVASKKILNLLPGFIANASERLVLHGFPFGYKIKPLSERKKNDDRIHVAVVHEYTWIPGHTYPNAPVENLLEKSKYPGRKWKEYDVVVFGDNHKGFLTHRGITPIFNCGSLMRRASDEIDYKPQVGLLLSTGEVVPHFLDISKDKHLEIAGSTEKERLEMNAFLQELELLGDSALDFVTVMKRFFAKNKTIPEVKKIILGAMENG